MTVSANAGMPGALKTLQSTNIGPLVPITNVVVPRVMARFLESLDNRQRSALDQVMPVGGKKKIYFHVTDSPTPPILVMLAQPPKLGTISLADAMDQQIPGIRLTTHDMQLLSSGLTAMTLLKLPWRVKSQVLSNPGLVRIFMPLLRLGSARLKDMGIKLKAQLDPLLGIF